MTHNIKFSIIIPTRNREVVLDRMLNSVRNLRNGNNKLEIVFVDNNSYDNTKDVIKNFISQNPNIKCRYYLENKIGPAYARNLGVRKALYENIIFLDDDVLVQKDLLIRYQNILNKFPDASIICGKCTAESDDKNKLNYYLNILGEDSWVFSSIVRREKKTTILKFPDDLISANMCINLKQIKGKVFDESFGRLYGKLLIFSEDSELTLRLLSEGKKVIYEPSIKSRHLIDKEKLNIKYILNRFFRAGIEHRLIDQKFSNLGYRSYYFSPSHFIRLFFKYVGNPKLKNALKVAREFLYLFGYYFPINLLK